MKKNRNLISLVITFLMPMFIYGQSVSGTVADGTGVLWLEQM